METGRLSVGKLHGGVQFVVGMSLLKCKSRMGHRPARNVSTTLMRPQIQQR